MTTKTCGTCKSYNPDRMWCEFVLPISIVNHTRHMMYLNSKYPPCPAHTDRTQSLVVNEDENLKYATNIAVYGVKKFAPHAKNWEPLDTLNGVLSQISNLLAGTGCPAHTDREAPIDAAIQKVLENFKNIKSLMIPIGITKISTTGGLFTALEKLNNLVEAEPAHTEIEPVDSLELLEIVTALIDESTTGSTWSEYSQQQNKTMSLVPTNLIMALEKIVTKIKAKP